MARRKGSTGHTLSSVWRIAVTAAWCIMATALLALVVRYAVTGGISRRNAAVAAAYRDSLERVAVPAPSDRLEYCGFTVYFNRRWHLPWCVVYELTWQAAPARGTTQAAATSAATWRRRPTSSGALVP